MLLPSHTIGNKAVVDSWNAKTTTRRQSQSHSLNSVFFLLSFFFWVYMHWGHWGQFNICYFIILKEKIWNVFIYHRSEIKPLRDVMWYFLTQNMDPCLDHYRHFATDWERLNLRSVVNNYISDFFFQNDEITNIKLTSMSPVHINSKKRN